MKRWQLSEGSYYALEQWWSCSVITTSSLITSYCNMQTLKWNARWCIQWRFTVSTVILLIIKRQSPVHGFPRSCDSNVVHTCTCSLPSILLYLFLLLSLSITIVILLNTHFKNNWLHISNNSHDIYPRASFMAAIQGQGVATIEGAYYRCTWAMPFKWSNIVLYKLFILL